MEVFAGLLLNNKRGIVHGSFGSEVRKFFGKRQAAVFKYAAVIQA
jgi:hypothetical protein